MGALVAAVGVVVAGVTLLIAWREAARVRQRGLDFMVIRDGIVSHGTLAVGVTIRAMGPAVLHEAQVRVWGAQVELTGDDEVFPVFDASSEPLTVEVRHPRDASPVHVGLVWRDTDHRGVAPQIAERHCIAGDGRYERWVWRPWWWRLARRRWTGRWVESRSRWVRGHPQVPTD